MAAVSFSKLDYIIKLFLQYENVMSMIIYVNSKLQEISEDTSVTVLLETLSLIEKRVAIEVNKELVTRREWPQFKLKAGDRVEIVSFIGGG